MLFKFLKKVDKANKLFMPKIVIEKLGKEFYLEVYVDKIVLIPVKKGV